jgi:Zn-dependent M28 family amino/carboxypeptidase
MIIRYSNILIMIIFTIANCSSAPKIDFNRQDTSAHLRQHVKTLSDSIGERNYHTYDQLNAATEYITAQFSSMGYAPSSQKFTVNGKEFRNIIAVKKGTDDTRVLVCGSHYDTADTPGADDNASGIAGLLETARLLKNIETGCTIEFAAFANEEPPFFKTENMGSAQYASLAKKEIRIIKGVIILEMIGFYTAEEKSQKYPLGCLSLFYPDKGNYISIVSNFSSSSIKSAVKDSFRRNTQIPVETISMFSFVAGIDFSDHWAFWQEGYDAVMITDTSFYRNSNYHQRSDTYDTLDYTLMNEVVQGVAASLIDISNTY